MSSDTLSFKLKVGLVEALAGTKASNMRKVYPTLMPNTSKRNLGFQHTPRLCNQQSRNNSSVTAFAKETRMSKQSSSEQDSLLVLETSLSLTFIYKIEITSLEEAVGLKKKGEDPSTVRMEDSLLHEALHKNQFLPFPHYRRRECRQIRKDKETREFYPLITRR